MYLCKYACLHVSSNIHLGHCLEMVYCNTISQKHEIVKLTKKVTFLGLDRTYEEPDRSICITGTPFKFQFLESRVMLGWFLVSEKN